MSRTAPAIEGWFATEGEPALLGTRCRGCGTVHFPRETDLCRNPACAGEDLEEIRLSRQGRVWSYTDARYQPPPPYMPRSEPFKPFALAAVELEAEGMIVLGQVADGFDCRDLRIGTPVELVVEPLYAADETTYLTWRWRPLPEPAPERGAITPETGAGSDG